LLAAEDHHASLEVGMIGNEGMTGIAVFMGVNTSRTLALVQGAGTALRMTSGTLRKESNSLSYFHRLLHRYSHSLLTQMSLSSACNRFHTLDSRLARLVAYVPRIALGTMNFGSLRSSCQTCWVYGREGVNKVAGDLQKKQVH